MLVAEPTPVAYINTHTFQLSRNQNPKTLWGTKHRPQRRRRNGPLVPGLAEEAPSQRLPRGAVGSARLRRASQSALGQAGGEAAEVGAGEDEEAAEQQNAGVWSEEEEAARGGGGGGVGRRGGVAEGDLDGGQMPAVGFLGRDLLR